MASCLELFAFRYRDPRTGKWVRARYRAEREEIAARYTEWEIIGSAEIRDVDPDASYFAPHATLLEMPPDLQPAVDTLEASLLSVFLRWCITYCARRRRYAAMNGAAELYTNLQSEGRRNNKPRRSGANFVKCHCNCLSKRLPYSQRSSRFASCAVCHCMLPGASAPPRFNGTT